jgi:hypothetical protein
VSPLGLESLFDIFKHTKLKLKAMYKLEHSGLLKEVVFQKPPIYWATNDFSIIQIMQEESIVVQHLGYFEHTKP